MKETVTDLFTQQQERLTKIGAHLQQIRTAKGWSLELTARKTKIRTTLLKHIEAGNLEALPEPVYVRGLIQCYGDHLGLNGQAIAATFPHEDLTRRWQMPRWTNLFFHFQLRPVHLYIVYLFVIVTTVQSLSNVLRTPSVTLAPELNSQPADNKPTATRNPPVKAASLVSNPATPPADVTESVVIDVKTQETAWMRVEIDGKTAFEGTLPKGTQKQWVADETVKIRAGNAGAVYITINNETPHRLGEPGEVEEFTYQAMVDQQKKVQSPS